FIVDLHNQGISQHHSGGTDLLTPARLHQRGAETCGLQVRDWCRVACAPCDHEKEGKREKCPPVADHIISLPPACRSLSASSGMRSERGRPHHSCCGSVRWCPVAWSVDPSDSGKSRQRSGASRLAQALVRCNLCRPWYRQCGKTGRHSWNRTAVSPAPPEPADSCRPTSSRGRMPESDKP